MYRAMVKSGDCNHYWIEAGMLDLMASLVPRPFPPPVFDRFQYEIAPSYISYWKRSNTGGGNGLGTRLPYGHQPQSVHTAEQAACSQTLFHYTLIVQQMFERNLRTITGNSVSSSSPNNDKSGMGVVWGWGQPTPSSSSLRIFFFLCSARCLFRICRSSLFSSSVSRSPLPTFPTLPGSL